MANSYRLRVGKEVDYLSPFVTQSSDVRWRTAKITAVTDQNNIVLAIVNQNGTRTALNGGAAVPRRTSPTQTNVWRQY